MALTDPKPPIRALTPPCQSTNRLLARRSQYPHQQERTIEPHPNPTSWRPPGTSWRPMEPRGYSPRRLGTLRHWAQNPHCRCPVPPASPQRPETWNPG